MVTFTCTGCGGTLKKKQVDTHRTRCRNSNTVSCIDCLKDFVGQEYDSHTKCISEAQRYGAADAEAPVEKGALKQQQWMKTVHEAIENVTGVTQYERTMLEGLTKYDNLPRKKSKFVNFMKNSVKIRNEDLVEKIWGIFETAMNSANGSKTTGNGKAGKENECPKEGDSHTPKKEKQKNGVPEVGDEKMTKKEKKRKNSAKCSETPDETENDKKMRESENNVTEVEEGGEAQRLKKKDKKNKQSDGDGTIGEDEQDNTTKKPKKDKKKKKRDSEFASIESDSDNVANNEEQGSQAGDNVEKLNKKKKKEKNVDAMESNICDAETASENPSSKKKRKNEDDGESVMPRGIETTQENGLPQDLVNGDKILSKKDKRKKKKEEQKLANDNANEVAVNDVDASLNGSMEVDEQCTVDVPRNLSKKERKKLAKRLAQEQEDAKRQTENVGEEEETNQKLTKKEKKRRQREECRSEQNGVNKAISSDKLEEEPVGGKKKGKKNKKRMLSGGETTVNSEEIGVKKSKKHKAELADGNVNGHAANEDSVELKEDIASDEEEESPAIPRKFRWDKAIKTALKESAESEMSVKKLKKKVLAHYIEMGGEGKGEVSLDDLSATFNYKLSHNPKFKVFKDKVSLTSK